jgi:hypothetical protein
MQMGSFAEKAKENFAVAVAVLEYFDHFVNAAFAVELFGNL